jgi:uncharacterized protein YbbK (DUF523 family)
MPDQGPDSVPAGLKIKVAVSSCLLGQQVRYDGGHKRHQWVAEELVQQFELVAVCPEVGIGMGTPRKPIQLRDDPNAPRARGVEDPTFDVTSELQDYAKKQLHALKDICGYIFKSRSPSCGLYEVPVYDATGAITGQGSGVYAGAIVSAMPGLPVIDESSLSESGPQQDFVQRVLDYHQLMEKNDA